MAKEVFNPTEKSASVESALSLINDGKNRRAYILAGKCVKCDGDARLFVDEVSRREFSISGWCQHCQDEMFIF